MNCMNLLNPLEGITVLNGMHTWWKCPYYGPTVCPNRKFKDEGWRGGGSKCLLQHWVRRPSKTQLQGWRSRSSRGHCRACSFSFSLLLGYCTLSFSIMGCSSLRFPCTVAPPLALWLSSVHLSSCFLTLSLLSGFYCSKQVGSCCRGMHLDPESFFPPVALNLCSLKEKCGI